RTLAGAVPAVLGGALPQPRRTPGRAGGRHRPGRAGTGGGARAGDRRPGAGPVTDALTLTTPADREIVLRRTFAAPRHLVFSAFTRPSCCVAGTGRKAGGWWTARWTCG